MSEIYENEIIEENSDFSEKDERDIIKGEKDTEKNKANENNINIINDNVEDNTTELMNFMYSEEESKPKSTEKKNKRRNLSEEGKRKKDTGLDIDSIKEKLNEKLTKLKIKNIDDDKEYKQLKEDIDKGTNFIDYFLIIGVEPEDFFDDKIYECDIDELKSKYKDILQPKIISYFPKYEKKTIAFDDSIISHCFPNGFNIIKSNKMPKTEIFSFILDNNYFNLII